LWGANGRANLRTKPRKQANGEALTYIETNILNSQIRVCTCRIYHYPLSHKSTKEATTNKKKSLYSQIALQEQHHHNKNPKNGPKTITFVT